MERATFRCACCRRILPKNPRVKNQRYCGSVDCQRARKRKWQREKMDTDPDYRANQRDSQRSWRQRNPDYWQRYRCNNPHYRRRNRRLQRARDDLAKMDTLSRIFNDTTMTYLISPEPGNRVKMDALEVKIVPVTPG